MSKGFCPTQAAPGSCNVSFTVIINHDQSHMQNYRNPQYWHTETKTKKSSHLPDTLIHTLLRLFLLFPKWLHMSPVGEGDGYLESTYTHTGSHFRVLCTRVAGFVRYVHLLSSQTSKGLVPAMSQFRRLQSAFACVRACVRASVIRQMCVLESFFADAVSGQNDDTNLYTDIHFHIFLLAIVWSQFLFPKL